MTSFDPKNYLELLDDMEATYDEKIDFILRLRSFLDEMIDRHIDSQDQS